MPTSTPTSPTGPVTISSPPATGDQPPAPALPARPSPLPVGPRTYPHFLRTPRARWWKGLLAIVLMVVGYLLASAVFGGVAITVDLATGRMTPEDLTTGMPFTPAMLLATNIATGAMIPLSMLIQWMLFGQRPRWTHSVQGRFRWGWLARAAVVVAPIYLVFAGLWSVVGGYRPTGGTQVLFYLTIIVLTTPLQAAGEEYAARGLINRAAGSWFASPVLAVVVGTVINSALFMVAHGATDPWLWLYYFCFGAIMSVLAWRTGGLEVPVLLHTVNNVFMFVPTVLAGEMDQVLQRGDGVGSAAMLVPIGVGLLTLALVEWRARRVGVVRSAAPGAPASVVGSVSTTLC